MAIPKAASEAHLLENFGAQDLVLSDADRADINAAFPPARRASALALRRNTGASGRTQHAISTTCSDQTVDEPPSFAPKDRDLGNVAACHGVLGRAANFSGTWTLNAAASDMAGIKPSKSDVITIRHRGMSFVWSE